MLNRNFKILILIVVLLLGLFKINSCEEDIDLDQDHDGILNK
jgi:hypothetical protein